MNGNTSGPCIGLIGAGEMGSGIGGWLVSHGADVRTTLAGRSAASAERVRRAGIGAVDDLAAVARCPLILSIVPPDRALAVAEGFVAAYVARPEPPVYVDCNAIAPETARAVAAVITAAGIRFVDAGIIGGTPREGYDGPHIYACGPDVAPFAALDAHDLHVRVLEGPIGVASGLKMCYGGLTKGITGIGSAMFACAENSGLSAALEAEFSTSQPALFAWLTRQIPTMYPKAYRWDGEMREIATFGRDEAGVAKMYEGLADRYAAIGAAQTAKGGA
jgi:L-threonate 2-dehydrogenase